MRITLNLATRPYADQGPAIKRLRIGMAVLVVILAGLGFGLLHFHQAALRMAAQEDVVNQSIARVRQEQQGYEAQMQQPANARVLKQAEFLNKLFDEKTFSWTAAMEDLERVLPAGVQVTAIEPARGKDGRITLHLRIAGQRERSVEMVRNLEHSRRFTSPRITGENAENNSQGALQPVRDSGKVSFDVLAEYNPATLDERKAEIAAQKHARPSSASAAASGAGVTAKQLQPYVPPIPAHPQVMQNPQANPGPAPPQRPGPQPMPPDGAQNPQNPGMRRFHPTTALPSSTPGGPQ
jgi:type IV pilus assembly protein PilN